MSFLDAQQSVVGQRRSNARRWNPNLSTYVAQDDYEARSLEFQRFLIAKRNANDTQRSQEYWRAHHATFQSNHQHGGEGTMNTSGSLSSSSSRFFQSSQGSGNGSTMTSHAEPPPLVGGDGTIYHRRRWHGMSQRSAQQQKHAAVVAKENAVVFGRRKSRARGLIGKVWELCVSGPLGRIPTKFYWILAILFLLNVRRVVMLWTGNSSSSNNNVAGHPTAAVLGGDIAKGFSGELGEEYPEQVLAM